MGFPLPELSTVVNDIWFKVDAIGKVGEQLFAIDFTEDISLAPQKLDSIGSDGNRDIIGEA